MAEISEQALLDIRDRLFPSFNAHSLASLYPQPELQVGALYRPGIGFEREDFLAVSCVPSATRPMATVDSRSFETLVRFFICEMYQLVDCCLPAKGYPVRVAPRNQRENDRLENREDIRNYFNAMASSPDSPLVLRIAYLLRKAAADEKQPA